MHLNSINVRGFRGLTNFKLGGLRQVNLIIGRNNAGKTSLIEAIYLLEAEGGNPFRAICRDEDGPSRYLDLFSGRPSSNSSAEIQIDSGVGTQQTEIKLNQGSIEVRRPIDKGGSYGVPVAGPSHLDNFPIASSPILMESGSTFAVGPLWERILLTPYQDDVRTCLRLVIPNLVDVALSPINRKPIVRLKGATTPVSMASLGGGTTRLFHLSCGLVVSKGGVFLVDEIENGVHHSVHREMWGFIFKIAKEYDIQVFATTHSLDCLRGFAWASHEIPDVEARVIRLDNHDGQVEPVMFDEEEFQIAAEEEIEIR